MIDPALAEAFKALNPTEEQARALAGYFGDATGAAERELGQGWDAWRTQDGAERTGVDWSSWLAMRGGENDPAGLAKLQALLEPHMGAEVSYERRQQSGAEGSTEEWIDFTDPITGKLNSIPSALMQSLEGRDDLTIGGAHYGGSEGNAAKQLGRFQYGYEMDPDGRMTFTGGRPDQYAYDNGTGRNLAGILAVLGGAFAGAGGFGAAGAEGAAGAGAGADLGSGYFAGLDQAALSGAGAGADLGSGYFAALDQAATAAPWQEANFGVLGPTGGTAPTPGGWGAKEWFGAARTGLSTANALNTLLNGGGTGTAGTGGTQGPAAPAQHEYSPVPWAQGGADFRNRPMYVPGVDPAPDGWQLPRGAQQGLPVQPPPEQWGSLPIPPGGDFGLPPPDTYQGFDPDPRQPQRDGGSVHAYSCGCTACKGY